MSRTRRRKRQEEHVNHEAWAIPYGDLITLLLAFFVVMYAISSVNEGKYRVLSDSLFAAFRGVPRTLEPVQVGEKQVGSGADIHTTIVEQAMLEGQPRSLLTPIPVETGLPRPGAIYNNESVQGAAELRRVAEEVERAMRPLIDADLLVVRRYSSWIEVEIRTDILFPSGSAQLSKEALIILEQLADVLKKFPNAIRVEGHTDNVPISTVVFRSNWELSAARAGSVVHVFSSRGVNPARLAVIGFGEYRPVKPNDTPEGRNANRRVVLVILSPDVTSPIDDSTQEEAPTPADAETPPAPTPVSAPVEDATHQNQIAQTRGTLSAP